MDVRHGASHVTDSDDEAFDRPVSADGSLVEQASVQTVNPNTLAELSSKIDLSQIDISDLDEQAKKSFNVLANLLLSVSKLPDFSEEEKKLIQTEEKEKTQEFKTDFKNFLTAEEEKDHNGTNLVDTFIDADMGFSFDADNDLVSSVVTDIVYILMRNSNFSSQKEMLKNKLANYVHYYYKLAWFIMSDRVEPNGLLSLDLQKEYFEASRYCNLYHFFMQVCSVAGLALESNQVMMIPLKQNSLLLQDQIAREICEAFYGENFEVEFGKFKNEMREQTDSQSTQTTSSSGSDGGGETPIKKSERNDLMIEDNSVSDDDESTTKSDFIGKNIQNEEMQGSLYSYTEFYNQKVRDQLNPVTEKKYVVLGGIHNSTRAVPVKIEVHPRSDLISLQKKFKLAGQLAEQRDYVAYKSLFNKEKNKFKDYGWFTRLVSSIIAFFSRGKTQLPTQSISDRFVKQTKLFLYGKQDRENYDIKSCLSSFGFFHKNLRNVPAFSFKIPDQKKMGN